MLSRRRFLSVFAASVGSATAGLNPRLFAQVVGKTTHIVVGFPAGGSTDVVARLLAEELRGSYASTIVVDNKPGAGGRIAAEQVKNSEADGSTILLNPAAIVTIYPHVYKKLSYDPLRDFAPVTTVCTFPLVLSVGPGMPPNVKTIADFVQWAKTNPQQASYGSPAPGTAPHFVGVMLARAAGIQLIHIPYKGGAPAIQDLLGGQLPMSINVLVEPLPHIQAGKLRALATTGDKRSPFLPDVPTFKELGYAEIETNDWFGVFVPRKTPADIVTKLNASIRDALRTKKIMESLARLAFEPSGESPTEFAKLIKDDYDRWGRVVKASGFSIEE